MRNKTWQIRVDKDREKVSKRKQKTQNGISKVGGFGSKINGNTSHRAFTHYKEFIEITGVKDDIIFRLHMYYNHMFKLPVSISTI